VAGVPEDPLLERCHLHGTALHIDAVRGLVCADSDAELDAWMWAVPGRLWRALMRLFT